MIGWIILIIFLIIIGWFILRRKQDDDLDLESRIDNVKSRFHDCCAKIGKYFGI